MCGSVDAEGSTGDHGETCLGKRPPHLPRKSQRDDIRFAGTDHRDGPWFSAFSRPAQRATEGQNLRPHVESGEMRAASLPPQQEPPTAKGQILLEPSGPGRSTAGASTRALAVAGANPNLAASASRGCRRAPRRLPKRETIASRWTEVIPGTIHRAIRSALFPRPWLPPRLEKAYARPLTSSAGRRRYKTKKRPHPIHGGAVHGGYGWI